MLLAPDDASLYFRLQRAIVLFGSKRLKLVPDDSAAPEEFLAMNSEVPLKVRDALFANTELIERFTAENPAGLPVDELEIVRSWRHFVAGRFYIFRDLAKYTVFLSTTTPAIAYGVLALAQPFVELIGARLPFMTQAVLLPFKGKLIYDGLLNGYGVTFGPGIRRMLDESFREAKTRHGIVTSLPMSAESARPPRTPQSKPRTMTNPKEATAAVLTTVIGLIDRFCREHLNDEYAALCRKLAEKLARKRPSPLLSGSPNAWASGIVRTIGSVNFLGDKSQSPYLRQSDIDAGFGISESAGAAKLAAIRRLLKIYPFDPNWTLPR